MKTISLQEVKNRLQTMSDRLQEVPPPNRFSRVLDQGPSAYPLLVAALDEPEEAVRMDALALLGRMFQRYGATDQLRKKLLGHLPKASIGPEKQAVLFALAQGRDTRLTRAFLAMLGHDRPDLARAACIFMGHAKVTESVPYLEWLATHDGPQALRGSAVWALAQIGGPAAKNVIGQLLVRGELLDWVIGAAGDLGDPELIASLISTLGSPVPFYRYAAVNALTALADKGPTPPELIDALKNAATDDHAPVALGALMLLAQLRQPLTEAQVSRVLNLSAPGPTLLPI